MSTYTELPDGGIPPSEAPRTKTVGSCGERFKKSIKCKVCSCGCCCTWFLLFIALIVVLLMTKKFVAWCHYMALPKGLSMVALNYSLVGAEDKKLPTPSVGSTILLSTRCV
ncbi:hypothetical protein KIPB_000658 [Kipferlia bialata]|uniref:Uncharacterized protein n=1 Tax=Kipferlia bialata TaxID=797122 RepID=A0A9K3CPH1_9EUKA|nr:hypothetical protein KIPB_000658 [Kipferlia bialata]|eukprot:g658.t1